MIKSWQSKASPHRLVAQDAALSRPKPGFEFLWGHTKNPSQDGFFFCPTHTIEVQGPNPGFEKPPWGFLWGHTKSIARWIFLLSRSHHRGAGPDLRRLAWMAAPATHRLHPSTRPTPNNMTIPAPLGAALKPHRQQPGKKRSTPACGNPIRFQQAQPPPPRRIAATPRTAYNH